MNSRTIQVLEPKAITLLCRMEEKGFIEIREVDGEEWDDTKRALYKSNPTATEEEIEKFFQSL